MDGLASRSSGINHRSRPYRISRERDPIHLDTHWIGRNYRTYRIYNSDWSHRLHRRVRQDQKQARLS